MSKSSNRQIVERMAELRELLAVFNLRLHGYDPGVTCLRKDGRLLEFGSAEWAILEPLLIELRSIRTNVCASDSARRAAEKLKQQEWLLADVTPEELEQVAAIIANCFAAAPADNDADIVQRIRDEISNLPADCWDGYLSPQAIDQAIDRATTTKGDR